MTMWAAVISSYGTPLGLMTQRPSSRDTALALPKVYTTNPRRTSSRLASRTSARSASSTLSSSGMGGDAAQLGQHIADRRGRRSALAEREVEFAIKGKQFLAGGRLLAFGLDGAEGGTKTVLRLFDRAEGPRRHECKNRRTQAGDIAIGHQDRLAHHV